MYYLRFYDEPDKSGGDPDVDVNELSQEELQRASVDEEDKVVITPEEKVDKEPPDIPSDEDEKKVEKPKEPEGDEKEDKVEKPDEKEPPAKPPEKSLDEQISDLEKIPKEERTEVQILQLRHLNAEKKLREYQADRDRLQQKYEEQAEKLRDYETKEEPKFEELTEEEEEELMVEDPEEYRKYQKEKAEYEQHLSAKAETTAKTIFSNIATFYKEITGKTKEDLTDTLKSKEFNEWLETDDFKRIDLYVTKNMTKLRDGTYSVNQIRDAHFVVNRDSIVSGARAEGRKEAVDDIKGATRTDASELDKVPKETGIKGAKKISDYTPEEIQNLSPEEHKRLVKQMELEGMA